MRAFNTRRWRNRKFKSERGGGSELESLEGDLLYFLFSLASLLSSHLVLLFVLTPPSYKSQQTTCPSIIQTTMTSPALQMVSLSIAMDDDMTTTSDDDIQEDYLLEASDLLGDEGTTIDEAQPASYISAQRIAALRITHRRHEKDVGSPEYQVAGMTERISHLTSHLKLHPKDFSTRRGLVALVNKRRRLLNYLFISNKTKYVDIVGALGIRHKVPGAIPSKEDQYGEFPKAKSNRGKSKMKISGNKKK